jgi:hypothetical protein
LSNMETKVSVVETKVEYLHESIDDIKKSVEENKSIASDLRDLFFMQNGAIPHLAEEMKQVLSKLDSVTLENNRQNIETENARVKIKFLWTLFLTACTGLVVALIKILAG